VQDRRSGARDFPWRIEVFDAQQPLATMMPGIQVATDCCDERAEVQGASGRGRKPAAIPGWGVARTGVCG
jgi:hypothetical protein